ncbi:MAG: hypothetical protein PT118_18445 [Aphanizomenon gracile PMC644.10]|nr:hypothetical protein [Aphanizomenon gracile PMC644.10]
MLTTIAKRIQTRLSKQGVKVALSDIRPVVEQMIQDIENPTEQEVLSVVEYFLSTATDLTVIANDVDSVDSVDNFINTESIQNIDDQDDSAIAPQTDRAPLAITDKGELITSTATQMGIVLDASEISLIAENINNSSDNFDQDIDAIKAAIMAFINHKSLINQSKINSLIHEVREVVSEKNSQNSQLLSDGLRSINQDIQEANKQFKSSVKTALSAFELPALKAS